jgi:hypothetical protein
MFIAISGTNWYSVWCGLERQPELHAGRRDEQKNSAVCETRRAPNLSTIRELAKLAIAMPPAIAAKISGNLSPAPKCSATSCCEELM